MDSLCQYFESASLHEFEVAYNVHNMEDMKAGLAALRVMRGCMLIIWS